MVERRLRGLEARTWLEIDKLADQSYDWYCAARAMRRSAATWRDAPAARGEDLYADDRRPSALHLFAAEEGGWGEGGHLVSLSACAVLLLDRQGRGAARLTQLCVSAPESGFEWEWRVLDAADLLAERRGHLWLSVSATEGSSWCEALIERGYRPQAAPPGERADGVLWLIRETPLRDQQG